MQIILDLDDLRDAVEMYVMQKMSIEYNNADVIFPIENQEWNLTAIIGEFNEAEK